MSTDKAVTKDLMETLADGQEGFSQGASKLNDSYPEIARTFQRFSSQRATFYSELEGMAKAYGDDVEEFHPRHASPWMDEDQRRRGRLQRQGCR